MEAKRRLVASIAGAGAALLLSAPAAFAEARFASPTGTSLSPCTLVAPCDIVTAINKASPKDDVTIEPGTYGPLSETLYDKNNTLTIHGQASAPRPVITKSAGLVVELGGFNSSLSDVEVDVPGAASIGIESFGPLVSIDRVISHALGSESYACEAAASVTMTNSLCVADGVKSYAFALFASPSTSSQTLRNDTLEAPGGSGTSGGVALWAEASGYHVPVTLINTIAHGARFDLLAEAENTVSSEATIVAEHSNYLTDEAKTGGPSGKASVTKHGTETNQAAAPQFVNTAIDDFHELAGSPTVGAGFGSPANGMLDLDSNPRQFGGRTDIGAYQFIPPPATTAPPTAIVTAPAGGGATPAPSDSQPVLSPTTFATLASGPSVVARTAKGTTISYTDTQAARTTFVVRRPAGKGVLAHGKCVKPPRKRKGQSRGKSCALYTIFGSFTHTDTAGANHFRFSGRLGGRALKPGRYQLVSAPTNASGKTGPTHVSNFKIVSH